MALERALFLRQQADLIRTQENLRQSAELVVQPGKKDVVKDLMAQAVLDLESSDKKASEGEKITTRLSQVGFVDVPLDTFADRLRTRPPVAEEGALARIIGEASAIEDDLAIKETVDGLEQMRQGNREAFRASSQKATEHSTKAEEIAKAGKTVIEEIGDFPIENLLVNLGLEVLPETVTTEPKTDDPEKDKNTKEEGAKLKRGERLLMVINAVLGVGQTDQEVADTLDNLVIKLYEDKKADFPDPKRLAGYYRSNTKNDIKRILELLESAEKLDSALIDISIKSELQKIQTDPKISALSLEEKTTLAFREEGWEAILAKLKAESILGDPEQTLAKLDIKNTPIVATLQKIQNGEIQDHEPDSTPITEFTSFQERIWWRAFDLKKEKNLITGFKNVTFDDVLHDIFSKEIDPDKAIPLAKRIRVEEKIREIAQNLVLGLDRLAVGLSIPSKINRIIDDFGGPTLEAFSWLTPAEITQVLKRELDFETVKEIAHERWSASISPDQANAYLQEVSGE